MIRNLLLISLCAAALSSCIITPGNIVPDMPHDAMWKQRAQDQAMAARVNTPTPQQNATPTAVQPTPQPTAVTPTPVAVTPRPVTPVTKPTAKPKSSSTHITQAPAAKPTVTTPTKPVITTPTPKPVATPPAPTVPATPTVTPPATPAVPAPPAPDVTTKKDLSSITNENGVIPYAVRVPGDPTRVYNPLAPDLTIRTIDRNTGQPLPKNTVLKVNGTNFMFKVP